MFALKLRLQTKPEFILSLRFRYMCVSITGVFVLDLDLKKMYRLSTLRDIRI